jgi:hypothetical protein
MFRKRAAAGGHGWWVRALDGRDYGLVTVCMDCGYRMKDEWMDGCELFVFVFDFFFDPTCEFRRLY